MQELIRKENIKANVSANSWEDAVASAGHLLVESGSITVSYVDSMIRSVRDMGPYIVLTPGFALAHAAPGDAVLKPCLSLITLKNPVKFGSPNDPVKIIMCLACTDKATHMQVLSEVARKLMSSDFIERLAQCRSEDELYCAINS